MTNQRFSIIYHVHQQIIAEKQIQSEKSPLQQNKLLTGLVQLRCTKALQKTLAMANYIWPPTSRKREDNSEVELNGPLGLELFSV